MEREDIKMLVKKWWDIYEDESLDYNPLNVDHFTSAILESGGGGVKFVPAPSAAQCLFLMINRVSPIIGLGGSYTHTQSIIKLYIYQLYSYSYVNLIVFLFLPKGPCFFESLYCHFRDVYICN